MYQPIVAVIAVTAVTAVKAVVVLILGLGLAYIYTTKQSDNLKDENSNEEDKPEPHTDKKPVA